MLTSNGAPQRARWEVLWINPNTKRVERKPFGHDLQGAVDVYARVKAAGRKGATLRCCNMGFPPPDQYADREEVIVIVRGQRKKGKRMIEPRVYLKRMMELNLKGVWWCPYCMAMRRFKVHNRLEVPGIRSVPKKLRCPMCAVGWDDWHVQRYNPQAALMMYRDTTREIDPNDADANRKRERRRERREARKRAAMKGAK